MTFDDPIPFEEALEYARKKKLLPTTMGSAQIRKLEAEVKRRSVFSAKMTKMDILRVLKRQVVLIAGGIEDEDGRLRSIPEAKAQLNEALKKIGWKTQPDKEGTLQDFFSDRRRQLMIETSVLDTMGYGRTEAELDPAAMDVNPGWELVRMVQPIGAPRDWPARWRAAGESIGWEGAIAWPMIALKTSPIWQALGNGAGGYEDTLGNPWPPFAYSSGMNRIEISRADCEDAGLIKPGQIQNAQGLPGMNQNLEASLSDFDAELRAAFSGDPLLKVHGLKLRVANALRALIANSRAYRRDSIGRFARDGGPLSAQDNLKRGNKAMDQSIRNKSDVPNAMSVRGLGRVDFRWGNPGNKSKDFAGGFGVSHIIAKHGERDARRLPAVLAKGKVSRHPNDPQKRLVKHGNYTASLAKEKADSSWVITGFSSQKNAARNHFADGVRTQVGGRGFVLQPSYAARPSFGAAKLGAESNSNIAEIRGRLKGFLLTAGRAA